MNRADLVTIMAQAIRDAPLDPPAEVAEDAMMATNVRRALYLSYNIERRAAMIRRARYLARKNEVR